MLYLSTLAANRRQRAEEREGVIQMRPRSAYVTQYFESEIDKVYANVTKWVALIVVDSILALCMFASLLFLAALWRGAMRMVCIALY